MREAAGRDDLQDLAAHDATFHRLIVEPAGNKCSSTRGGR